MSNTNFGRSGGGCNGRGRGGRGQHGVGHPFSGSTSNSHTMGRDVIPVRDRYDYDYGYGYGYGHQDYGDWYNNNNNSGYHPSSSYGSNHRVGDEWHSHQNSWYNSNASFGYQNIASYDFGDSRGRNWRGDGYNINATLHRSCDDRYNSSASSGWSSNDVNGYRRGQAAVSDQKRQKQSNKKHSSPCYGKSDQEQGREKTSSHKKRSASSGRVYSTKETGHSSDDTDTNPHSRKLSRKDKKAKSTTQEADRVCQYTITITTDRATAESPKHREKVRKDQDEPFHKTETAVQYSEPSADQNSNASILAKGGGENQKEMKDDESAEEKQNNCVLVVNTTSSKTSKNPANGSQVDNPTQTKPHVDSNESSTRLLTRTISAESGEAKYATAACSLWSINGTEAYI